MSKEQGILRECWLDRGCEVQIWRRRCGGRERGVWRRRSRRSWWFFLQKWTEEGHMAAGLPAGCGKLRWSAEGRREDPYIPSMPWINAICGRRCLPWSPIARCKHSWRLRRNAIKIKVFCVLDSSQKPRSALDYIASSENAPHKPPCHMLMQPVGGGPSACRCMHTYLSGV